MAISAGYDAVSQDLTVTGDSAGNAITVSRDVAGSLLVNNGAVPVAGGTPTVANTDRIAVTGDLGNDTIALDEANGALPQADLAGGGGDDALTGGSGADVISGEAGLDTLLGRGGNDLLDGGTDNDTLVGGDGDDQMFGGLGNDLMIWNPGDDTDLWEGGDGTDTGEVNGGGGAETFAVTANGTRVRFDRIDPAPFSLDIGTTEGLVLNAGGGDDAISTSGNLAALISLTLDGGAGNDTILGGNGADLLNGGDDNDFIDGQQGNDITFLGAGDDTFQWDPGDGSDTVEGQAGTDALLFNGSAGNEIFALSANGVRTSLTRDLGNIVMDVNDLEAFTLNALGGTDTITVNDLAGTDSTSVTINLASTVGGATGDAAADVVIANGTGGADNLVVTGAGANFSVTGLPATLAVNTSEGANDALVLNGLGGNDTITAASLPAGITALTIDGGAGADSISGSQGGDTILAGDDNDFVFGDNGNDVAFLGAGDDLFEWAPGDGNDVIEGQAGTDELLFGGSNANESIDIAANGGRVSFFRDVASVTMDLDDVERIHYNAFGGADNVVVGNLTGTDATRVEVSLAASGGGGDGAIDTVTANATNSADTLTVASAGGGAITTAGLPWAVSVTGSDGVGDRLVVNGQAGDDVIDTSGVAAGLVSLLVNGGLGGDLFVGSAGNDQFIGGDGNDTALLGAGDDSVVWNPGDDNDVIEGQGGIDTLQFNGANVAESITIAPNGGRAMFLRDIATVMLDLNDTEVIRFAAVGGADTIVVNDLGGTDVTQLFLDLAATAGGAVGDTASDSIALQGTGAANTIALTAASGLVTVTGLPWTTEISQMEAIDKLTILAGGGDDSVVTAGFANTAAILTLDGGIGNDTLQSAGDGTYLGGTGDDLILAGLTSSSEVIDGGDGVDTLDTRSWGGLYTINLVTGSTNYSGESFVNFENLITGDGNDSITGTDAANVIVTNGADDTIAGGAGNDTLNGGTGNDTLAGGMGNDLFFVDAIGDVVTEIAGEGTADRVLASVSYVLAPGLNVEILTTTNNAGTAAINLVGNGLANSIAGNAGANTLDGGTGNDTLAGGLGDDFYYVDALGDIVVETAGQGNDRVFAASNYALGAGVHVELMSTTDHAGTGAINLAGNELANSIAGNAGNNVLDGGGGADTLNGLAGDDQFFVDNAGDVVVEAAGQGNDRVLASVNYALGAGAHVELMTTTNHAGTGAINLTGNAFVNSIGGNAGNNVLDGGGGADTLNGLGGDDLFFVDTAGDVVIEAAGQGNDRVLASANYALGGGVHVELMTTTNHAGTGAINLAGNELANSIAGNAGNNVLNGGGGADALHGLGGDDWFFVDNAGDVVVEAAGEGNDRVLASVSYVLGAAAHVEVLSTTNNAGTGAINLTGNSLVNSIAGNAGNNVLDGGGGADTLNGLAGDDSFFVDNAGDVVVEAAGQGNDRVLASVNYALGAGAHVELMTTTNHAGTGAINLTGNAFVNSIGGNAGNNVLDGGGGADTLNGLGGDDQFFVDTAGDVVIEAAGQGNDRVLASANYALGGGVHVELMTTTNHAGTGAINLAGNELANSIAGNAGNNVIDGRGGNDTLQGLGGADTFRFSTTLGAGNVDTVLDYSVAADTIQIDNAVFAGLANGALAAGAFNTGAAATQADDRIIYNSATGALLFDADGTGAGAAVQFATLGAGLAMTAAEFVVT